MKIEIIISKDSDFLETQEMLIEGQRVLSVGPLCECPEDAIVGRALISCEEVVKYMKMANEVGLEGESLTIEIRKEVNHDKRRSRQADD